MRRRIQELQDRNWQQEEEEAARRTGEKAQRRNQSSHPIYGHHDYQSIPYILATSNQSTKEATVLVVVAYIYILDVQHIMSIWC